MDQVLLKTFSTRMSAWYLTMCPHIDVYTVFGLNPILLKKKKKWRQSGRDGVSNHQPRDCLLNRLFRLIQSSASLAFVRGIHRWPVNSPYKWPVTRKMFPFDDVIMSSGIFLLLLKTVSSILFKWCFHYKRVICPLRYQVLVMCAGLFDSCLTIFETNFIYICRWGSLVDGGPIGSESTRVRIMACYRSGEESLSEPLVPHDMLKLTSITSQGLSFHKTNDSKMSPSFCSLMGSRGQWNNHSWIHC